MKLASYLHHKMIISNLKGDTICELAEDLIKKVFEKNKNLDYDKQNIIDAIIKRECENPTYLGYGIALPHGRLEHFDDILVFIGFPEKKVNIETQNGKIENIDIIILVVADILKSKKILRIMSGVSKLAIKNKPLLDKIISSKEPNDIIDIINKSNIEIDHNIVAEDIMTRNLEPVKPTNTLEDIAKKIILEKISGLPVIDENGFFLGEITEKELILFGMPKYTIGLDNLSFMTIGEPFEEYLLKEKTTTIENLYRKNGIITIDKEAPLMEVANLFIVKEATRIYVVEKGKYLGIIRRGDIVKKILHI